MSSTRQSAPSKFRSWTNDTLIALFIAILTLAAPLLVLREQLGARRPVKAVSSVDELRRLIMTANFGTLPAVVTILSVLGVVFAPRLVRTKAGLGPALAVLMATGPAWITLVPITTAQGWLNNALVQNAGGAQLQGISWLSTTLGGAMRSQLDLVAVACLKSALLLFAGALITSRLEISRIPGHQYLMLLVFTIAAVAARLTMRPELDLLDVVALSLLCASLTLITLVQKNEPGRLAFSMALALAVAFWELGGRTSAVADLVEIAKFHYKDSDWTRAFHVPSMPFQLPRWLTPQSVGVKLDYRGVFAIAGPLLVLLGSVSHRGSHSTPNTVLSKLLQTTAIFIAVAALISSATVLYWTGNLGLLASLEVRVQQFVSPSIEVRPSVKPDDRLPRALRGDIASVDSDGHLHWIAANQAFAADEYLPPLLVVAPNLRLEQVLSALQAGPAEKATTFRWVTHNDDPIEPGLRGFATIHWLFFGEFASPEFTIDPVLHSGARAMPQKKETETTAALVDGDTAVAIHALETNGQYYVQKHPIRRMALKDLGTSVGKTREHNLVLFWEPTAPADAVARALVAMSSRGFSKIIISTASAEMEQKLVASYRELSRAVRSNSEPAQAAFRSVMQSNPEISIQDLELIEGALVQGGAAYFADGYGTAIQKSMSISIQAAAEDFRLAVRQSPKVGPVHFGLSIERRTGIVRRTWAVVGDERVRVMAIPVQDNSYQDAYASPSSTWGLGDALLVKPLAIYHNQAWKMVSYQEASATVRFDFDHGNKIQSGRIRSMSGALRRLPDAYLQRLVLDPE